MLALDGVEWFCEDDADFIKRDVVLVGEEQHFAIVRGELLDCRLKQLFVRGAEEQFVRERGWVGKSIE